MTPEIKKQAILIAADVIRVYHRMSMRTPEQMTRIIQPMTTLAGYPSAEELKAFIADLPFVAEIAVFEWLDQTGETPEVVPGLRIECRSAVDMGDA